MIFKKESDVREYLKFIIDDIEDSEEMSHYDMQSIRSIIEIKVRIAVNKFTKIYRINRDEVDKKRANITA